MKFAAITAKDADLQAVRSAQHRGFYVNEDFSMLVVNRRKELLHEMRVM